VPRIVAATACSWPTEPAACGHRLIEKPPEAVVIVLLVLVEHVERQVQKGGRQRCRPRGGEQGREEQQQHPGQEAAIYPMVNDALEHRGDSAQAATANGRRRRRACALPEVARRTSARPAYTATPAVMTGMNSASADDNHCGWPRARPRMLLPAAENEFRAWVQSVAPNREPTPAVIAIASAPQKVTRQAPSRALAPPARAAAAPSSARNSSELPAIQ
jgi:hypothetical protein